MKIFYLLLALIPQIALSNSQITAILTDANDKYLSTFHYDDEFYDDMSERIRYEIEQWKAPKSEQRFFWREVILQTHYHSFFKDFAFLRWHEASEDSSFSIKDFEDIMVHAHYQFLQVQKEIKSSKIEHELKASELEHWSNLIDRLNNTIRNYKDVSSEETKKRKKEIDELDKIFRIRIDKSLHWKVLQNE